jgi:hypothetical protein
MEQYKEIPFAENYLVSNLGNVKSKRYNKQLKGFVNNSGYKRVQIGSSKNKHFIHRLVAETFLKKEFGKEFVNHKDGNKLNNSVDNLEWVTRSENDLHAFRNDLRKSRKGENHHNSKLTLSQVEEIKNLLSKNYNCTYIAEKYNVHRRTISDIKNKKTWK